MKEIFDLGNLKEQLEMDLEGIKSQKVSEKEAAIAKGRAALDAKTIVEKIAPEKKIEDLNIQEEAEGLLDQVGTDKVMAAMLELEQRGIEPLGLMISRATMGKLERTLESLVLYGRSLNGETVERQLTEWRDTRG